MLAPHNRLTGRADFTRTLKYGVRVNRRDIVVHSLVPAAQWPDRTRPDVALARGPRVGLVVSKAVGNAVTRHAVSRKLRAAAAEVLGSVDSDSTIVLRALPSSLSASKDQVAQQISSALAKAGR